MDTWLNTIEPSFRRSRGLAIERLVDEVVYRQLVIAEERPTLMVALETLSAMADDAREDLCRQQDLFRLFVREPRLRDLGALFVAVALRRARSLLRVQRFYPAVMLQRILDTIDGRPSDDDGTQLIWNILKCQEANCGLEEIHAAAVPIARGYELSTPWPTPAQAQRVLTTINKIRAPWERAAGALLHVIEARDGQIDDAQVARSAGISALQAQRLRLLTDRIGNLEHRSQERLLHRALVWPSGSARVLGNLAAEHGLLRLYYAYLHSVLGGIEAAALRRARALNREVSELTVDDTSKIMPELFARDCVWPMAIALDSSFAGEDVDLFTDDLILADTPRQRLRRQREACLATSLPYVDDDTMQMLDEVHELYYCQEAE